MLAPVLTTTQLDRIKSHRYSSQGKSLIEPPFQLLWNYQLQFVPVYVHPNVLTLAGFLFIVSGALTLIYHSPSLKHEIPSWCFFYNALCVFMYQSLDAIDGKQARKLKLSSPIGEIWDHGFDALTAVSLTLEWCIMVFLGNTTPLVFLSLLISQFSFYIAQWEYYCTGFISFSSFDVTEYLTGFILLNIATGFLGQKFWDKQIIEGWPANWIFFLVIFLFSTYNAINRVSRLILNRVTGPSTTTIAETSIFIPFFSFLLIAIMYISIFIKSKMQDEISEAFVIYHFLFGITISKITLRLIISTITKSEFHIVDTEFAVPVLLFFNQYFGYIFPETISVIYLGTLFQVANFFYYFAGVTLSVSNQFGYPILIVPSQKQKKEN